MKGRWLFQFKGSASATIFSGEAYGCSDDAPLVISSPQAGCVGGLRWEIYAANRGNAIYYRIPNNDRYFFTCGSGQLSVLSQTFTPDNNSPFDCGIIAFDCINAGCIPSTEYNTPGIYSSLSECEQACGTGCSGKCIANADWQKIQELANQLKNKNCN